MMINFAQCEDLLLTFSIVARDPSSGFLGVATATAGPVVGALVPHGVADLGAIATQAMTNPYLAFDTLALLPRLTAPAAMTAALGKDPQAQQRQFIVVDRAGEAAGWTGSACEGFAGHRTAAGVAVAGNILEGPGVLGAMLDGYGGSGTLAYRLLAALMAGEKAGGDVRGTGSAAIKIFGHESFALIDLRIDWSPTPLAALSGLLEETTSGGYAAFFDTVPRRRG